MASHLERELSKDDWFARLDRYSSKEEPCPGSLQRSFYQVKFSGRDSS